MNRQGRAVVLLACAWILWIRSQPHEYIGNWSMVQAFDAKAPCEEHLSKVQDQPGRVGLPKRSSYPPSGPRPMICLPDTVEPD